ARLLVRAGVERLLRPASAEPAPILHPRTPAQASIRASWAFERDAGAALLRRLARPHEPARRDGPRRPPRRAPGARRRAHLASGPARRAAALAVEVRDRRHALTGLCARDRRLRLPVRRCRTHARRPGAAAARRAPRDEFAPSPAFGVRADPDGGIVRARLARPRDEQVRAVPVPVPARGDPAGAAPGPPRRGPGDVGRSAEVGAGRIQRPDAASSNAASYPATMASLENRRSTRARDATR